MTKKPQVKSQSQGNRFTAKEALLCTLHELLAKKKNQSVQYEDLIVEAHTRYPSTICIKGYPQYPDSEVASKRLYDLKRDGDILITKRYVTLTEKGRARARSVIGLTSDAGQAKLGRDVLTEIDRIKKTEVYHLYHAGKLNEIVDTDFFAYLGTSVKADRLSFLGRLKTVDNAISAARATKAGGKIAALHQYLMERFKGTIEAMKGDR